MDYKQLDQQVIVNSYKRQDLVLQSGTGATGTDVNGKTYIDFTSGIGVNSLGFCNADWVAAVSKQAGTLQHISNLYYTTPQVELAKMLCDMTGLSKVFFGNSGAEANEGAIKIARKYSFDKYGQGRHKILTLNNSFHGRTITTLQATGQEVFHNYFFPFTEGFEYCDAGDFMKAKAMLDKGGYCAVMVELVQGEGGVVTMDAEFIKRIKTYCDQNDILFIADEVQTGIGRTGTLLACEQFGVKADVVTLAKGLGGGLPIGAILCGEKTQDVLGYSDHGTTFGGNPVVCAGAKVVLESLDMQEIQQKGVYIRKKLSALDEVKSLSGLGLMIGIELNSKDVAEVVSQCLAGGLIVLSAKTKVRILPPLNITYEELDRGINVLTSVLASN